MKLFATLSLSLSLSLFVVAACGGKSSSGGTTAEADPTAEAGPTCAEMAANVTSLMRTKMPELDESVMTQANELTATSCTDDAWSPEAIKCFDEAAVAEEGTCEGVLTPAQEEAYGKRLAPLFMAAEVPAGGGEGDGSDEE